MPDITTSITDLEKKALDFICADISEYADNFLTNRARKAKEEIIALNTAHCNANSIAIAVGEAAQVEQAYSLGVIKTAAANMAERAADSDAP